MRISDWSSDVCSSDLKNTYLPKLATGEWSGTMCMTEPQAGSDLAAVKTKAHPQDDGSFLLEGSKIFITSGEHERSEEHTSELQSLMRISYAVFCLKKKKLQTTHNTSQNEVHKMQTYLA